MNVDNEKVLQQNVLLTYTVLPCQWLEEIFTKILSGKHRQHAREVVRVFKDKKTEGERRGQERKEEVREQQWERLAFNPLLHREIVSSKMRTMHHLFSC